MGVRRAPAGTDPEGSLRSNPPVLIWGAGAMGGTIGGVLAREGQPLVFVDRAKDHVRAMNERGLRITGPLADFSVSVKATDPDDLQGMFETLFLCVKSHHTRQALAQLEPHLADDGAVVSIQNGLCEAEIAAALGPDRTVGAFVNFGADYLEPGVIHWGGRGAVVVGELDGQTTPRVRAIHRLLRRFEPDARLTGNIFGYLWGKLAYAALLFATALTDGSIADVLAAREHRPVLIALAREVVAVAEARDVALEGFDGFDPEAFRSAVSDERAEASLDDLVTFNRRSAKTHSGIWRDLAVRKRPTEVDAQLGAVVRLAREVGVRTPLTERLVGQIHEIERGKRERSWSNLEELR
ncbi:MAG: 2-dehydropantoate 2-reductase [Gemmatimonadales bacterium]